MILKSTTFHWNRDHLLQKILAVQNPNGSFISTSIAVTDAKKKSMYQTIFFAAQILTELRFLPDQNVKLKIQKKAAAYLNKQKSAFSTWNYWARHSAIAKQKPYPDDLDDTFAAFIGLYHFQPSQFNGRELAKIIQVLTNVEVKEGGPYRTWLIDQKAAQMWQDVDAVVNSNVAAFLALLDVELPGLNAFLTKVVQQHKLTSPYYPSVFSVAYFMARGFICRHPKLQPQFSRWLRKQWHQQKSLNPLETALLIKTLLLINDWQASDQCLAPQLASFSETEIWQAYPFCYDPAQNEQKFVAGSEALTATFVLAAQAELAAKSEVQLSPTAKLLQQYHLQMDTVLDSINQKVRLRIQQLPTPIRKAAQTLLRDLLVGDTDLQIRLLPFFFAISLTPNQKQRLDPNLLIQLGMANVWGWMAYRIYDDFFDQEGNVGQLAVANFCLREMSTIFATLLPLHPTFATCYQPLLDELDNVNAWEFQTCRLRQEKDRWILPTQWPAFKKLDVLATKSLGHLIGPLAIMSVHGHRPDSIAVRNFLEYGKAALIARQLNDDAHDWEEDLAAGRMTVVTSKLLQKYLDAHLEVKAKAIPTLTLTEVVLTDLRSLLWQGVMEEVANTILTQCLKARQALSKCLFLVDQSIFLELIEKSQIAAELAKQEQLRVNQFLASYR